MIGPLVSEHGTCGLILLLAARGQGFTPLHQRMLQAILEPLALEVREPAVDEAVDRAGGGPILSGIG